MSPCKSVPLARAIFFKRAAVSRDIENVIFVFVFSSLPRGFVRKCPTFRFLISPSRTFSIPAVSHSSDDSNALESSKRSETVDTIQNMNAALAGRRPWNKGKLVGRNEGGDMGRGGEERA